MNWNSISSKVSNPCNFSASSSHPWSCPGKRSSPTPAYYVHLSLSLNSGNGDEECQRLTTIVLCLYKSAQCGLEMQLQVQKKFILQPVFRCMVWTLPFGYLGLLQIENTSAIPQKFKMLLDSLLPYKERVRQQLPSFLSSQGKADVVGKWQLWPGMCWNVDGWLEWELCWNVGGWWWWHQISANKVPPPAHPWLYHPSWHNFHFQVHRIIVAWACSALPLLNVPSCQGSIRSLLSPSLPTTKVCIILTVSRLCSLTRWDQFGACWIIVVLKMETWTHIVGPFNFNHLPGHLEVPSLFHPYLEPFKFLDHIAWHVMLS